MKSTGVIVTLTLIFGLLSAAMIVYVESSAGNHDSLFSPLLFVLWNTSGIVLFCAAIFIPINELFIARRYNGKNLTTREAAGIDDEHRAETSESVERRNRSS